MMQIFVKKNLSDKNELLLSNSSKDFLGFIQLQKKY